MAIVGQRNGLAVEVTVETRGRIKALPLTIQTGPSLEVVKAEVVALLRPRGIPKADDLEVGRLE